MAPKESREKMDRQTELRLAAEIVEEANRLKVNAARIGVSAYLEDDALVFKRAAMAAMAHRDDPLAVIKSRSGMGRRRPNENFLRATMRSIEQGNKMAEMKEMWRRRQIEMEKVEMVNTKRGDDRERQERPVRCDVDDGEEHGGADHGDTGKSWRQRGEADGVRKMRDPCRERKNRSHAHGHRLDCKDGPREMDAEGGGRYQYHDLSRTCERKDSLFMNALMRNEYLGRSRKRHGTDDSYGSYHDDSGDCHESYEDGNERGSGSEDTAKDTSRMVATEEELCDDVRLMRSKRQRVKEHGWVLENSSEAYPEVNVGNECRTRCGGRYNVQRVRLSNDDDPRLGSDRRDGDKGKGAERDRQTHSMRYDDDTCDDAHVSEARNGEGTGVHGSIGRVRSSRKHVLRGGIHYEDSEESRRKLCVSIETISHAAEGEEQRDDGGLNDEEMKEFLRARVKRGRGAVGSRMDEAAMPSVPSTGGCDDMPQRKAGWRSSSAYVDEWENRNGRQSLKTDREPAWPRGQDLSNRFLEEDIRQDYHAREGERQGREPWCRARDNPSDGTEGEGEQSEREVAEADSVSKKRRRKEKKGRVKKEKERHTKKTMRKKCASSRNKERDKHMKKERRSRRSSDAKRKEKSDEGSGADSDLSTTSNSL